MNNIFVGNLSLDASDQDIRCIFEKHGTVERFRIMTDRQTGKPRGFAFVEMGSQEDATKAISMFHQKDFQGRALTVNEARPREDRPAGGGGYGGGRGGGGGGYRERR